MPEEAIAQAIKAILGEEPAEIRRVSGGDISEARHIRSRAGDQYFLKFHRAPGSAHMFACEAHGLALISESGAIRAPEILAHGDAEGTGYLLLTWIERVEPGKSAWRQLGEQLAALHRCYSDSFGLDEDNFIGSLPQSNTRHDQWGKFYADERITPQIQRAQDSGVITNTELNALERLVDRLTGLLPNVRPALIHGDLWGGNIMFDRDGPLLIDPAVAYGHGMMDIAMSRLFGGFSPAFYDAYHVAAGETVDGDLIDLYQLYYLLVHVNLFGRSYAPSVMRIVRKFV